jgi:hypothetical protein
MATPEDQLPATVGGEILSTDPPVITPKNGWLTSEGQITAAVTLVLSILSGIGVIHMTDTQTNDIMSFIHNAFTVIVPIAGVVTLLWSYINSRGKLKSNAVNATAAVQLASTSAPMALAALPKINFKDPSTYLDIAKIAAGTGLIPGPAGKILDSVVGQTDNSDLKDFEGQVADAFKAVDSRLKALESKGA